MEEYGNKQVTPDSGKPSHESILNVGLVRMSEKSDLDAVNGITSRFSTATNNMIYLIWNGRPGFRPSLIA